MSDEHGTKGRELFAERLERVLDCADETQAMGVLDSRDFPIVVETLTTNRIEDSP
jgi:hypothetical protein